MEAAHGAGLGLENICGGNGTCGKCRVKVLVGEFEEATEEEKNYFTREELLEGYRLACRLVPKKSFRTCEILLEEIKKKVECDDREAKVRSINEALGNIASGQAFFGKKAVVGKQQNVYGVAIDIGTTNVEMVLVDLQENVVVNQLVFSNPQGKYGADIVSRISYAMRGQKEFEEMCEVLQKEVMVQMKKLLSSSNIEELHSVQKVVVAGNAGMMHFISGYSVEALACAPYKIRYKKLDFMRGERLGVPQAEVILLPNIESFVGADTVGVLTFLQNKGSVEHCLMIDIGTNGEMAVCHNGKYYVASTAAGPALEGAVISCGMRAEYGAVLGMTIGEQVELRTVGDGEPKGICGSGLIEVIAELYRVGIVDETGYLIGKAEALEKGCSEKIADCIEEGEHGNQFVLYKSSTRNVKLTQKDIREFQLAKAAICAGVELLLEHCKIKEEMLEACFIAGALGTHMNIQAALKIGLLPSIASKKLQAVGNAALFGCCMVLMNEELLEQVTSIAEQAEHISLCELEQFQERYIECMNLSNSAK